MLCKPCCNLPGRFTTQTQNSLHHLTPPTPTETLKLLSQSPRPWPTGPDGLRAAARAVRASGRLVIECESLAAAPEYGDGGEPAAVDWRDDAT